MQERCSAGLGAPTSWVRRDGRRRTQGLVDPGAGAQSGPVPAGSAAVLISGEVAGDSRADGGARPREELISREVLLASVAGGLRRGGGGPASWSLFEGEEADGDDNFEAGGGTVSAFDGRGERRGLQRGRRWLYPLPVILP